MDPLSVATVKRTKHGVQGWLKRRGGPLKTWSRRWCVLNDKFLFMYLREDDKNHQESFHLDRQTVAEPTPDIHNPQHGYFDIVTGPSYIQSHRFDRVAQ